MKIMKRDRDGLTDLPSSFHEMIFILVPLIYFVEANLERQDAPSLAWLDPSLPARASVVIAMGA